MDDGCENCGKEAETKMFDGFELCKSCAIECGWDWDKSDYVNWSR